MNRILIAEDEPRIAAFVDRGLRSNGYTTTVAVDGHEAFALAESGLYDLLILDLGLPGMDGLTVLRQLRDLGRTLPAVILTGRRPSEESVAALDRPADDFIAKPFRFEELLARAQDRLRVAENGNDPVLHAGDASLDLRGRRVTVAGRTVELTAPELALAEVLFRHPGSVVTRDQLLGAGSGYDDASKESVVDVYARYLGTKLGEERLTAVPGGGYRLETGGEHVTGGDHEPGSLE